MIVLSNIQTQAAKPQTSVSRQDRPQSPWLLEHPPLFIGVGGMLWRAWDQLLRRWEIPHRSPSLQELDLTKPQTIERALASDCRLVINCAAYTDVDGAEKNEALATAINGTGVGNLARICRQRGVMLVHYSTDYVFNGQATQPYHPHDPRQPLSAYGRSKAVGEQLLMESGCRHLLVRTSWLYAPWAKNFVRTIVRLAKENKPLRIVNDQRGRPTSAEHLAATTLELIEQDATGIYHVTDGGECTWFEFAREIARLVNPACPVNPCTTADLARPAARPAYSTLDLESTERLLGPMPHWKLALADVISRLEPL
ncbi:MAG: dTDP-4-dehydrorhamnose reductase [Bacillota bacterium]